MSKKTKALELLKQKGLDGIPYLKYVDIKPSPEMYDLIKQAETLGYIPIDTAQIKPITWLPYSNRGWGNGYVSIPEGHKFYGKNYDELYELDVNGGLTYSEPEESGWVVGFDTAHSFNDIKRHGENFVKTETMELLLQIFG
jgi:hypothetical protein